MLQAAQRTLAPSATRVSIRTCNRDERRLSRSRGCNQKKKCSRHVIIRDELRHGKLVCVRRICTHGGLCSDVCAAGDSRAFQWLVVLGALAKGQQSGHFCDEEGNLQRNFSSCAFLCMSLAVAVIKCRREQRVRVRSTGQQLPLGFRDLTSKLIACGKVLC